MASNNARPVPDGLRDAAHPVQWSRLLPLSLDRLAGWGNETRAVPLAGEAYVLVYRKDRFSDAKAAEDYSRTFSRPLAAPSTWEEYATTAEFFADRGQPSLIGLANEPERLLRDFHHVAACYDRPPLSGATFGDLMKKADDRETNVVQMLAFHHDLRTGEPRLLKPAFLEAAKWLHRTARCRASAPSDANASLISGSVVMAILSLQEVGELSKNGGVLSHFGIAPLPGTKVWYDSKTGEAKPPADKVKSLNFVPYYKGGGWVGVVPDSCPHPDAAFDLLADLSRLERSVELLSDPTLGFGPFRVEHLDEAHETLWQRYGFDAHETHRLAEAIRHDVSFGLANPAIGPRGSDQAELMKLLAEQLKRIVEGAASPEEAMKAADAAWRRADRSRPADVLLAERRRSAGIQ